MSDDLLNGRPAEPFKLAAIAHGRRCERERDMAQLAGLIAVYPRPPEPVARPVTDVPPGPLS